MIRNVAALLLMTVSLVGAQLEVESEKFIKLEPRIFSYNIHLVNDLKVLGIMVHCKSRDDDLGVHYLPHRGDDYHFGFNVNVWQSTLFWCKVEKQNTYISFESFWTEVRHTWLRDRCQDGSVGTCIWKVKDDGIYLRNNAANTEELVHTWIIMR
ncbi:S-protein homolog 1-like [Cucurbita pepo subsp. pepo]|uniref:S-protein homolog 1-like n=1 Tax=Cucurbita pepo subsp. pepo TaxID=3664 RepID=UPI000C9D94DF|nr:S-protein homolog 1-like [Cucurbita pepo subsp. pepo]